MSLPFEKPIEDVRSRLEELEELASKTSHDLSEEIDFYRDRLARLTKETYSQLSPWQRVQVARHPDRPLTSDYIQHLFEDFIELHGDGFYSDDPAVVTGLGTMDGRKMMVIGHRKGRATKERMKCNFGSAHPEGYRKALRKMQLAERLQIPILTLVNTPGAYPGVGAEERGQARAIAENIFEMFGIKVPILVVVIGEGGSGGALGIAVGDRVGMLENSWYSVISPEGCASILWRSAEGKEQAAEALKLTAGDLQTLGIVDQVIPEPMGGAHQQPDLAMAAVKDQIVAWLDELQAKPLTDLLAERHLKFRQIAQIEAQAEAPAGDGEAEAAPADPQLSDRRFPPLRDEDLPAPEVGRRSAPKPDPGTKY
ncbi:MAG: acetyl-CoA carboxylase carboxyltransferase subunit alpha [Planctomycetota bacterium]|nr:MAG: acetyl-CoA carboxylase carboxyltransferase subunit alpha [Planctomycetota bacterium]